MDLYRTLRVSIYLLATSGAFAVSFAEGSPFYLFITLLFGAIAYWVIDTGRAGPVRAGYAGALALALLIYFIWPLREERNWDAEFPAALMRFLCALQVLLFYTAYRTPALFVYCGMTLAVVVLSGMVQPGVSLLPRMIAFVGAASWALFIYALWQSRQIFKGQQEAMQAGRFQSGQYPTPGAPPVLPRRAFWQGLALTGSLSAACLLLGAFFFFTAPRAEGVISWLEGINAKREGGPGAAKVARSNAPASTGFTPGMVDLRDSSYIRQNHARALSVTFNRPLKEIADSSGRIFFRGMVYSSYQGGVWLPSGDRRIIESPSGGFLEVRDPSIEEELQSAPTFSQRVEHLSGSDVYFGVAPIAWLDANKAEIDSEGGLWAADKQALTQYEVVSHQPVYEEHVSDNARAEHPEYERYVRNTGLRPDAAGELLSLAQNITAGSKSDVQKALAIATWLRRNQKYTLRLNPVKADGDAMRQFLLGTDPALHCGHCGYFATAFVVLCRLSHMPARLCSGYVSQIDAQNSESRMVFTNADAHAWSEVYFKGVGWVPFDATSSVAEEPASVAQGTAGSDVAASAQSESDANEGFFVSGWEKLLAFNSAEQHKIYQKLTGSVGSGMGGIASAFSGHGLGGWIGAGLLWAASIVMLWLLIHAYLRRSSHRMTGFASGGTRARAAVAFYNELLQMLSRRGFVRRAGQTPREFAAYVVKRGGGAFAPVLTVTEVFEHVRYGAVEIDQEEFNRLQTALESIREQALAFQVKS